MAIIAANVPRYCGFSCEVTALSVIRCGDTIDGRRRRQIGVCAIGKISVTGGELPDEARIEKGDSLSTCCAGCACTQACSNFDSRTNIRRKQEHGELQGRQPCFWLNHVEVCVAKGEEAKKSKGPHLCAPPHAGGKLLAHPPLHLPAMRLQ